MLMNALRKKTYAKTEQYVKTLKAVILVCAHLLTKENSAQKKLRRKWW